jgi:hypothetical protein
VCEPHKNVFAPGELLNGFAVIEELIDETIEKAEEQGSYGEIAARLLRTTKKPRTRSRASHEKWTPSKKRRIGGFAESG